MPENVSEWLESLGLGDLSGAFAAEQIVLEDLQHLTDGDLRELGVPLGPRKRLLRAIEQQSEWLSDPVGDPTDDNAVSSASPEAERRQLTVMFCDLVGSTELAQTMDPEDMRDLNRAYQDACKEAIERFEGYVARYMGDGVLAYFGYPTAHEDDVVRALIAGLAVVQSLEVANQKLNRRDDLKLGVRVGIATGFVVVGDLIGEGASQENAVVGETPNLAARLQGLAAPNTVVIGNTTRELAAGRFVYEDLGPTLVKGIAEPIPTWRVVGEAQVESQFIAARKNAERALVGRDIEVALLMDRWQQAKSGDGQVVLLSGEAGIGKSRITQSLIDQAKTDDPIRLNFQCSAIHTHTALYPVIEQLERAAAILPTDPPTEKLEKLESLLVRTTDNSESSVPLFAALLSLPLQERHESPELTPERQKEHTLIALADYIEELSRRQPVMIIFEDLHWIDPTTVELLEMFIERARTSRILIINTFRPQFTVPWRAHAHITSLSLNRLSQNLVEAMIEDVTGGKSFSPELVSAIVEKTDGVPLFVEELTKTVLESGLLTEHEDRYVLSGPLEQLEIPISLHDSLMSRLDRLGDVKEVAQHASALGREFSYDVLDAISPLSGDDLESALESLVDAELLFRTSHTANANYIFKHALVQDAAYGSLLKSTRLELHQRIAVALETSFPDTVTQTPELLAFHYSEARIASRAVHYWLTAGKRALARSDNIEAIAHLRKGLKILEDEPQTDERSVCELDLQLELTSALTATAGYSAADNAAACVRAQELCGLVGDTGKSLRSLYAVWCLNYIRPNQDKALELAEEFKHLAKLKNDRAQQLAGFSIIGHTCATMGNFPRARRHFDMAIELYHREQDRALAVLYGEHPGIGSKIVGAAVDWMMGYPDLALRRATENKVEALEIAHDNTFAWASLIFTMIHKDRQDQEATLKSAAETIEFTSEHGIPYWRAMALALQGWALVDSGDFEAGREAIEESLAASQATGSRMRVPDCLSVLALGYLNSDQPEMGMSKIDQALNVIEETGERWNEVNIRCLRGQLYRSLSQPEDAETSFRHAIKLSREQGSKSYELRAATQLSEFLFEQGNVDQASALLTPVFEWFTEGFDTRDWNKAKALLDRM